MCAQHGKASVVAVMGSPRAGNCLFLVDRVLEALQQRGHRCERILLGDLHIAPCQGHDECDHFTACPQKDDAADVLEKLFSADCLIMASPVYFENVSAQMKALMDRTCWHYEHERRLKAKVAGLIAVAEESGLRDTLDAMRRYLALIGDVECIEAAGIAHLAGDVSANEGLVRDVERLADRLDATLAAPSS